MVGYMARVETNTGLAAGRKEDQWAQCQWARANVSVHDLVRLSNVIIFWPLLIGSIWLISPFMHLLTLVPFNGMSLIVFAWPKVLQIILSFFTFQLWINFFSCFHLLLKIEMFYKYMLYGKDLKTQKGVLGDQNQHNNTHEFVLSCWLGSTSLAKGPKVA